MDPNACLARFLRSFRDGDFADASEAADDLAQWLQSGGFPPESWDRDGERINRKTAIPMLRMVSLAIGHHA